MRRKSQKNEVESDLRIFNIVGNFKFETRALFWKLNSPHFFIFGLVVTSHPLIGRFTKMMGPPHRSSSLVRYMSWRNSHYEKLIESPGGDTPTEASKQSQAKSKRSKRQRRKGSSDAMSTPRKKKHRQCRVDTVGWCKQVEVDSAGWKQGHHRNKNSSPRNRERNHDETFADLTRRTVALVNGPSWLPLCIVRSNKACVLREWNVSSSSEASKIRAWTMGVDQDESGRIHSHDDDDCDSSGLESIALTPVSIASNTMRDWEENHFSIKNTWKSFWLRSLSSLADEL
jgi:hypothetical protein